MAHKPRKKKVDYKPYPPHQGFRSGIKVSWNYYKSREDAELCSIAAKHNAVIQESLGYDFGYCAPGSIMKCLPGNCLPEHEGLWEVCLP